MGVLKRIVVIDVTGEDPIVLINPRIMETSGEQTGGEGGECRFSGAGRASEHHKLTGVQIKVHTVENRPPTVGKHNTIERHYGLSSGSASVSPSNLDS